MQYTEDFLIADNRRLVQKLQELENMIPDLEMRKASQYDSECTTYPGGAYAGQASQGIEDEETLESIAYCISATEELCGVAVHDYSSSILPPSEALPSGKWKEISMNLIILDSLKAAITVIEGEQNGTHRVLSLECVSGETPLARRELGDLIEECCSSTPPQCERLIASLADYARMNGQRHAVIKAFKDKFPDVKVQISKEGVAFEWPGELFEITWGINWCNKTEKMQDNTSIQIGNHANPSFLRECESSLVRLTEFGLTPEIRFKCLLELAKYAAIYH